MAAATQVNNQAQDWLKTFLSESLAVEDIPWECSKALIILKQGYQVRSVYFSVYLTLAQWGKILKLASI